MRLLPVAAEGFRGSGGSGSAGVNVVKISEIFYSIQGEGILAGVPSVFLRTSGCNLRCTWCDTPYTSWKPEGDDLPLDIILADVRGRGSRHVVVTGGEPMIQQDIVQLTQRLKDFDLHITIETAGTVYQPVTCDLMSISPKLANSTPTEREDGRWATQHDRLRYQPGDLAEIETILKETSADRSRVVLMPEGTSSETLSERARWLVAICKREGFRYGPRLHIDIYGNQRGV